MNEWMNEEADFISFSMSCFDEEIKEKYDNVEILNLF
jgi:hypothetical protein